MVKHNLKSQQRQQFGNGGSNNYLQQVHHIIFVPFIQCLSYLIDLDP
jgi:hypothetical protein